MPVIKDLKRPHGVVYTPPEVARPMAQLALDPLAAGKSADEILALRVIDPAAGTGAFLRQIIDVLAGHLIGAWSVRDDGAVARARRQIAEQCVFGVDVDDRALATARQHLGVPDRHLIAGDALHLSWSETFPAIAARGGFDAVIANPPYVRQEWLARNKQRLREFASYDGVADLYVYFVELAHQVLRAGGRYCLITPNKWMTAAYGKKLRSFLADQGSVDGVVDLGRASLFRDADAFPCIVWGTTGSRSAAPIRAARSTTSAAVGTAVDAAVDHERARWGSGPWHIDAPDDRALLERLEQSWPRLGEVISTRPSRGVVTGCNQGFVIDRVTRDQLIAADPASAELIRPFVKGRDVRPWKIADAQRWILLIDHGTQLDRYPAIRAHLAPHRAQLQPRKPAAPAGTAGRKPGRYAWYELQDPVGPLVLARGPRLLYQDIQTAPACALDRGGSVVPDTTVWILPSDDRFLLAVLNSRLYGWYARRRFPPALNGAVRPKLAYMMNVPIADPPLALREQIRELVDLRIATRDPSKILRVERDLETAVFDAYRFSARDRRRVIGVSSELTNGSARSGLEADAT
ncbi:MAG: N-6 DNA methylase [Kofleriaceae bacterium]